jgi:hypothetical protein
MTVRRPAIRPATVTGPPTTATSPGTVAPAATAYGPRTRRVPGALCRASAAAPPDASGSSAAAHGRRVGAGARRPRLLGA